MLFNLGELLVNLLKNFSDNKLSIVVKEMGSEFIVKLRARGKGQVSQRQRVRVALV